MRPKLAEMCQPFQTEQNILRLQAKAFQASRYLCGFNKIMETMVPGFRRVKGTKIPTKGISPGKEVTWHHIPGTDTLQLVWRYQHEQSKDPQWNAFWQKMFHPGNKKGALQMKRNNYGGLT
ncbi:hypothetical protein [Pseudomonas sp. SJZ131]|uniref:hypothetical protein n=1 Tax=Pseudomonas sp. SJZ131 TaxID=2572895 RepID=UPI0011A52524|nr:hypothetical protein [Pseudomonas sp. SJZ131]